MRQVLIVGGGIAGLSLAIGLERHGLACEVIEKAPAFSPAGAGIGLAMTGMLVLRALGVSDAIDARGHRIRTGVITDALGRVLSRTRVDSDLGQGASMALEDVLVLSRRLAALEPPFAAPALAAALQAWEDERRPRVTRLQAQSRRLGRFLQRPDRWLCTLRDLGMRAVPERVGVASLMRIARGSPAR